MSGDRETLRAVLTWAEQRCPCENGTPDPCPLCVALAESEVEIERLRKELYELRARRSGLSAFAREANFICEHGTQARIDLVCRWCTEAALVEVSTSGYDPSRKR